MKIAVFGNFGVKNVGDDLILKGFLADHKDDEVIVFCGKPRRVKDELNLRAFPFFPGGIRSLLKSWFSTKYSLEIKEARNVLGSVDRIYIGGGGILVDRHMKAIILWWRQLKKIEKAGKPFEFISNSFELKHYWSRHLFGRYLRMADRISVRDSESLNFVESIGLKGELVDDLSTRVVRTVRKIRTEEEPKKISLALCQWGLGESQKLALKNFIETRKLEGYQFVGLAFQSEGDDDRQLYEDLDPSIPIKSRLPDILDALASSELLVGMRFHSVLLALNLKVPVIALAYQDKVANLMKDRELTKYCLPIRELNDYNLGEMFEKLNILNYELIQNS